MVGEIIIYTDGAARGNPGPGGYGIVMRRGDYRKEFSQGYRKTTNNRMELLAVVVALEKIKRKDSRVVVYTDSKYVAEAVNRGWVFRWESKRFKKKKNPDLWKRFLDVYRKHKVRIIWIKGHADNGENEKCDRLAVEASRQNNLAADQWYEQNEPPVMP